MKLNTLAVLALLTLATASPAAAAANKEHLQLMAEIRMLQEQNAQLQQLLGSLQDTLKTVGTKIDDQTAASRKAMADQALAINNIGDTVRVLREQTSETNVRISTVGTEIEALRQAVISQPPPQNISVPTGTDPGTAPPAGVAPAPTMPPVAPTGGVPVSPQRMFQASYDDYMAARYDLAIQGFENFLQLYPRIPQAADAQFNIGMSYYNQNNKWAQARDAFQKVVNDYPQAQGTVLPDAYYKLGQSFERLNQVDNAKRAYETVIQKFPGSFPATQARNALDRLNTRREE
jgi:tol-pal system protein YbgF